MVKKIFVTALALGTLLTAGVALAQTNTGSTTPPVFKPLPVTFPIAELGGCADKEACRVYCEDTAHRDACFAYAQTHGLMRKDEVEKARQFIKERVGTSTPKIIPGFPVRGNSSSSIEAILAAGGGPGACSSKEACKTYCSDTAHSAECLAFAKAHNLMTGPEIEKAKKLQSQVGPGGCQGEQCKEYCKDVGHTQVCVTFAEQNGFISKGDAQKRLEFMKFASTTKPLPPIDARGEKIGSSTKPFNKQPPPPPRPKPTASSTGEQSSSIFFSILRLLGL